MSRIETDPAVASGSRPISAERRTAGVRDIRAWDLGWNDAAVPAAVLISYDVEAFDVAAFASHGIAMPTNIERSVKKRQAEFFMGRLAAGDAVRALMEVGRDQPSPMDRLLPSWGPQIGTGASREPLWPDGMVGSISHAGRYAAAVAAGAPGLRGIGIDIECLIGAETRQSVEDTVLKPVEKALLHALVDEVSYEMLLTIAFSAKESFYKGSFATVGTFFDFDAVRITGVDAPNGTIHIVLERSLAPELPQGRPFTLHTGFIDATTVFTSFVW